MFDCRVNQDRQGLINLLLVWEVFSDIRRQRHKIRSRSISFNIFPAHPAVQFGQVVLSP